MYILKGFAKINSLVDNTESIVAQLGELSPFCHTFAREKTAHALSDVEHQGVSFMSFTSTLHDKHITPPDAYASKVVEIISWLYNEAKAGETTADPVYLQNRFLNKWGMEVSLQSIGLMVKAADLYLPEFITLHIEDGEENEITVWFADKSFLTQYDDFEIIVVPTIEPPSKFFESASRVREYATLVDPTEVQEKVYIAAKGYPYTNQVSDMFEWVDPNDQLNTVPIYFHTIIYGAAGDNLDARKEVIIDYLLNNSDKTRDEWAVIFPDLFSSTEFIFVPFWHNVGLPNLTEDTGLYSSTSDVKDVERMITRGVHGTDYTEDHNADVAQLVSTMYKGLHAVVIGGPKNRRGISKFRDQFPDYINLSTTHPDFGRMSQKTQRFVLEFVELLKHAETMRTSTPVGYTRVSRNGVVYVARTIDRVQYLVVLRSNKLMG